MTTGKEEESAREQSLSTMVTLLGGCKSSPPMFQISNVTPKHISRLGSIFHIRPKILNVGIIITQRRTNFILELIDSDKILEEGQDIFNTQELRFS